VYEYAHTRAHTRTRNIYARIVYLLSQNRAFLRPPHDSMRDDASQICQAHFP
jgi:hypothetical protein